MFQDRVTLRTKLFGAHWHTHLYVLNLPFSPCAAIHPYTALLQPLRVALLQLVDSSQDGIRTLLVGTVRVSQIARHVYLMGLHVINQLKHNLHVSLSHRQFLDASALVERQVEEVYVVKRNLVVGASRTRLTAPNQSLDGAYVLRVDVTFLLFSKEIFYLTVFFLDDFIPVFSEKLVEPVDEVHETAHLLVADGNVSARLVSHVHVVSLLHQSPERATHRDDIVVGVG